MKIKIMSDIKRYTDGRGLPHKFMCLFYYNGIYALLIYRTLNYLYERKNFLYKLLYSILFFVLYIPFRNITGVELHPQAKIGRGVFIPHCTNIIISKDAIIGENLTIHQSVTIGVNYNNNKAPLIGDNVFISCNSTLIGNIKIGNNVTILPNSCVTKSCELDGSLLGGVPAHQIIKGS
ncbi:hypothetical protein J7E63_25120 [Bacillus sp. ISL-75]|uniref:serine O-acetyltransferase n=1 Tax=Bacillus sp. ISL-75 TaxID=2819137 RepID=UPI001BE6C34B|nr:hypothetical protein [Bacillus sp. ISL-75]MBT2730141.1 hypothetical protein [Bacillus sp. ISL-75]